MRVSRVAYILFLELLVVSNISCAPYWYHDKPSVVVYPKGHEGPGGGQEIHRGMTKNEVLVLLGEPQKKYNTKDENEVWIYSGISGGGSKATLTFNNDKLEKIDEFVLEGFF